MPQSSSTGGKKKVMKTKNREKRREFSKVIAVMVFTLAFLVSVYSAVAMLIVGNLDALPTLIIAVFTEVTATTGFYYSKAKEENRAKITRAILNDNEIRRSDREFPIVQDNFIDVGDGKDE